MTIPRLIWKLLDDGAFVVGDVDTGATAYAYPTSPHADEAKKRGKAEEVAYEMAPSASDTRADYHASNWERLGGRPMTYEAARESLGASAAWYSSFGYPIDLTYSESWQMPEGGRRTIRRCHQLVGEALYQVSPIGGFR